MLSVHVKLQCAVVSYAMLVSCEFTSQCCRQQVSAQWIMGAEVKLPAVTIPDGLPEASKQVLKGLSQMVVDCTQFEAYK